MSSIKDTNEIQPLVSDFERIKQVADDAQRYFSQSGSALESVKNKEISSILLYKTHQAESRHEVIFNGETFWMPQKRMAELYGVDVRTVSYHLAQIYESGELQESATIQKIGITAADGVQPRSLNKNHANYNWRE